MAKKDGIFSAFRNLFRFAIWTLAGVLAAAIWFNWQSDDDVAVVTPDVVLPEVEVVVEPVTADVTENVAEDVAVVVDETAEPVVEAVTEGAAALEAVQETVVEAVEMVEETVEGAEESVVEAVEEAADDAMTSDPTTISTPGTDNTFTLINAFRRDNGAIEVTTEQVTGGTGATLLLVICAPLAVGTIATGPSAAELGARVEDPEMTEIPLSDSRAMIAATACGVMR